MNSIKKLLDACSIFEKIAADPQIMITQLINLSNGTPYEGEQATAAAKAVKLIDKYRMQGQFDRYARLLNEALRYMNTDEQKFRDAAVEFAKAVSGVQPKKPEPKPEPEPKKGHEVRVGVPRWTAWQAIEGSRMSKFYNNLFSSIEVDIDNKKNKDYVVGKITYFITMIRTMLDQIDKYGYVHGDYVTKYQKYFNGISYRGLRQLAYAVEVVLMRDSLEYYNGKIDDNEFFDRTKEQAAFLHHFVSK